MSRLIIYINVLQQVIKTIHMIVWNKITVHGGLVHHRMEEYYGNKSSFFDAGLTLFNVYVNGKPDMFRYFCEQVFTKEELEKLNIAEGAKRAELHFQISQKDKIYRHSEGFWADNYAEGLMGAGFEKEAAFKWAAIIAEKVDCIKKEYTLIEGVVNVLSSLKKNGYMLAVVSNWKRQTLKDDLSKLGILQYFDYVADSSVVGYSKPNPAIFEVVLSFLGIKPSEAIHIGDLYYTDVIGAQKAGIKAVLFDELDALGSTFNCQRICNISDVLELVEIINEEKTEAQSDD